MATDFSGAPTEQGGSLIPEGTLAFATFTVRPKQLDDGLIAHKGKDNPDNRYLDVEIELTTGPSTGRKVFHKLGVAGSEKWVNMSMAAIRAILEVGKRASASNPQGYVLGVNLPDGDDRMWMELDGLQCAVEVGIEPAKDGYKAKNTINCFLSPNPDSSTNKKFVALVGGATMSETAAKKTEAKPTGGNAWSQPAAATIAHVSPSAPTSPARPTWTGGPPPANTGAQQADAAKDPNKVPW